MELIAFLILCSVKIFSIIFYRYEEKWLTPKSKDAFDNIRLMVFLNHTSLYEPLFSRALPFSFLWKFSKKMRAPGADKTLNRPIVGKFWKLMTPRMSSITRKKDESWTNFMDAIEDDAIIIIAPEGRMKRPTGLDVDGKPMSVRGGIADILTKLNDGKMLLCYSGGLHHVQKPGQTIPKVFKTIKMNFELFEIKEYKKQFSTDPKEFKIAIVKDLQTRLETKCPS